MGILMGLSIVLVICLILFLATRPLSESDKKTLEAMTKQSNTSGRRSSSANRTNTCKSFTSDISTSHTPHCHYDDSTPGSSESGGGRD